MPADAVPADLPRLLVLSNQIPQTVYAGCILLHRLLRGYPPDRLVVVGPRPHPDAQLLACRYEAVAPPLKRLHTTRLAALKRSLDAFDLLPSVSPAAVRRRVGGFAPQVVVSVMEERLAHAAGRYAAAEGVPLVLIVHDKPELFDVVYPWARAAQVRSNAALYRSAAARLNVSPEMTGHLRDLYGVGGDVMYPGRSEDIAPRPPAASADLRHPPAFHVGYAGTLSYGYGHQLRLLARALRGTSVRLRVYGAVDAANDPLATELSDVVDCRGRISPPEALWPRVQAECDAVLLPYAWSAAADAPVDLYRTHFPSKLPEYLALGMPVAILGPAFATGVRWGLGHPDAAVTVTADDPPAWRSALAGLAGDGPRRVALAAAALSAGRADFDPVAIRESFLARLRQVARPAPAASVPAG